MLIRHLCVALSMLLLAAACGAVDGDGGEGLAEATPPPTEEVTALDDAAGDPVEDPTADPTDDPGDDADEGSGEDTAGDARPPAAEAIEPVVGERNRDGNEFFSDLRVCGPDGFDESRDECAEDIGALLPADAGGIRCSAMVDLPEGATLRRAIELDGLPVHDTEQTRRAGLSSYWFSIDYTSTPLPAGVYECVLSVDGEHEVRLPVGVAGEPGPVAWTRACDRADTTQERGFRACPIEAAPVIESPQEIVCSASFVGLSGADIRVGIAEDGSLREALDVTLNDAPMSAYWVGFPRSGSWPPGEHSCQWLLDGEVIGEVPFTVTE